MLNGNGDTAVQVVWSNQEQMFNYKFVQYLHFIFFNFFIFLYS